MSPRAEITAIDYTQCDKEPVATPGTIQSHGALMIVQNGVVIACSKNIQTFLPHSDEGYLRKEIASIAPALSDAIIGLPSHLPLEETHFQPYGDWLVGLRKSGQAIFVEFFPQDHHAIDVAALELEINQLGSKFHFPVKDRGEFLDDVCHLFQKHLRFDQVFFQVFHEGEFIEVIAEANNRKVEAVKGLHYSNKDIPAQARALYLNQLVRFKQNCHSVPVEIESPVSIDLSRSLLREVSNFLTIYMQNMSAASMLSFSVISGRKLSALLTLHNRDPIFVDPRVLNRLIDVVKRVSVELYRIDHLLAKNAESKLWELLKTGFPPYRLASLEKLAALPDLTNFLNYCGVAVLNEGVILKSIGEYPNAGILETIFKTILSSDATIFSSSKLAEDYHLPQTELGEISGVMIVKFEKLCILFFRKNFPVELQWRRANVESYDGTGMPRLSPSGSLQFWTEEFQNQSRPWSAKDMGFATAISNWISDDFVS